MSIDLDKLQIIIRKEINSQELLEIKELSSIARYKHRELKQYGQTVNSLKYKIKEIESRLENDVRVTTNILFEEKLRKELESNKLQLESFQKDKDKEIKLRQEVEQTLKELNTSIREFIKSKDLNINISHKGFIEIINDEEKIFEFKEYIEKSGFIEVSGLDELGSCTGNIVVKVTYRGGKITLFEKGSFRIYSITDGQTEMDLYLWNEKADDLMLGRFYAISKAREEFSTYNSKDIIVTSKESEIKEIQLLD